MVHSRANRWLLFIFVKLALTMSCGESRHEALDLPALANASRDIQDISLKLSLGEGGGSAKMTVGASETGGLSLDIGDLNILEVLGGDGDRFDRPLNFEVDGDQLRVGIDERAETISINYVFDSHAAFDGWNSAGGYSFLWPHFCGNLFPCHTEPGDGFTMDAIEIDGYADGSVLVAPSSIPSNGPSYMFAMAVGDYETIELGQTDSGTRVSAYYLPERSSLAEVQAGTKDLVLVFDFLERTLGAYSFGDHVATVSVDWGPSAYGGMEHHPYWHVSADAFSDPIVHAHEAAHGWFGNGVRIECWEDFVLSEGVVTYLAAAALNRAGVDAWPEYARDLAGSCRSANTIALPDQNCNAIDLLEHPLWSPTPYYKGAYFFRDVAEAIGEEALLRILSDFYREHQGQAARMADLLKVLNDASLDGAVSELETKWLRTLACPVL